MSTVAWLSRLLPLPPVLNTPIIRLSHCLFHYPTQRSILPAMFIQDHLSRRALFGTLSTVTPSIVSRRGHDASDATSTSTGLPRGVLVAIIAGITLLLLCAIGVGAWYLGLCGLGKIRDERRARQFQIKRDARQSLFAADLDVKRPPMNSTFTSPDHSRATSPAPHQDWAYSFSHGYDEKRTPAPSRRPSFHSLEPDSIPVNVHAPLPMSSTSRDHSPVRDDSGSTHHHPRRPKPKPTLVLAYRPPPSGDDPFTPVDTPAPVIRAFVRANNASSGHAMPPLPTLPQVPLPEKAVVQERRPLPVPRPSFS